MERGGCEPHVVPGCMRTPRSIGSVDDHVRCDRERSDPGSKLGPLSAEQRIAPPGSRNVSRRRPSTPSAALYRCRWQSSDQIVARSSCAGPVSVSRRCSSTRPLVRGEDRLALCTDLCRQLLGPRGLIAARGSFVAPRRPSPGPGPASSARPLVLLERQQHRDRRPFFSMVTGAFCASSSSSPKWFLASLADMVRIALPPFRSIQNSHFGHQCQSRATAAPHPVAFSAAATILAATASISASASVRSAACRRTATASDFLPSLDARAGIDVEQPHLADQAALDALDCLQQLAGRHSRIDHEGEITVDRRIGQRLQSRGVPCSRAASASARHRDRARTRPAGSTARAP